MHIYANLKDHEELCVGLTLAEAEKYGDELATVAKNEKQAIEASVARSTKAAESRAGTKAKTAKADLRNKVIQALRSTDTLEQELRAIVEPNARHSRRRAVAPRPKTSVMF